MTRLQVVVPMAGLGDRFKRARYNDPKPLLDVAGQPMIKRLLENFPADSRFIFICNEMHIRETSLVKILNTLAPQSTIVGIPSHKLGPVHTVLQAIKEIDDELPTIVNYCDFSFSWNIEDFMNLTERSQADGVIFCYRGFHPHYLGNTMYAYCREERGRVLEVREKGHFTSDRTQEYASSGTYFFCSGKLVKQYFQKAVDEGQSTKGEFYVSLVYNRMIQDGLNVQIFEIPFFLQWGTPEDLEDYLYWHRVFEHFAKRTEAHKIPEVRLVMPMAGLGTRFQNEGAPKPLIPVLGQPMFKTAQRFLPPHRDPPILICRSEIEAEVRATAGETTLVVLPGPTQGQADTTLKGALQVPPTTPVMVSACDHGLLWEGQSWELLMERQPDVVVVGQRGYPGARRSPQSFSYIDAAPDGSVKGVSVKRPLTNQPQKELVLVGTFYFAKARLLVELIQELIERNIRINGERYLDSVINLALERNLRVSCFESAGYLNWGSPEALAEFDYWYRYFTRKMGLSLNQSNLVGLPHKNEQCS